MQFKGKLSGMTQDVISGENKITFTVTSGRRLLAEMESIKDKEMSIKVTQYRKHRSLDANAYYWTILSQLAEKLRVSKPYLHNIMLRRYGQVEYFSGKVAYVMLPDTDETSEKIAEMEDAHFAPTSKVVPGKDGISYRSYKLLRGSHSYDSKEMADLINGLVDEAQSAGIETLTPTEIERMMAAYGKKVT